MKTGQLTVTRKRKKVFFTLIDDLPVFQKF